VQKHIHVHMENVHYYCLILTKTEMCQNIFKNQISLKSVQQLFSCFTHRDEQNKFNTRFHRGANTLSNCVFLHTARVKIITDIYKDNFQVWQKFSQLHVVGAI
jgi:hypothetical protein